MAVYNGIERYIFADLYNFYLNFKDMSDLEMNWENCIRTADKLIKKYKSYPLARALISEIMNLLECEIQNKNIVSKNGTDLNHSQWELLLKDSHYFEKFN